MILDTVTSLLPEETPETITTVTTTSMETLKNQARMDLLSAVYNLTNTRKLSLLELHIMGLDDLDGFLRPMLRSTTLLTKLWLKELRIPLLPVGLILRQCRWLEDLHIEVCWPMRSLIMTLFSDVLSAGLEQSDQERDEDLAAGMNHSSAFGAEQLRDNGLPKRIALKRLHLKDVTLKESTLLAILDSAPNLYELMIQSPPVSTSVDPAHPDAGLPPPTSTTNAAAITELPYTERWITCDRMEFFQDIGLQYPQLTSLHFTRGGHRYTNTQIRNILTSFPRASRWSLVYSDLSGSVLRGLSKCMESTPMATNGICVHSSPAAYTNHLTSLEIVRSSHFLPPRGNALHEFLCSSPLLEHLKAGSTAYYIENLDLNRLLPEQGCCLELEDDDDDRRDSAGDSASDSSSLKYATASRRVWACRNLKTLHLKFTRRRHLQHCSTQSSSYNSPVSSATSASPSERSVIVLENSPIISRIVYGYVARFCPRLQDLLIRGSRLNMTLRGGFCLLTRLRELKKMAIFQCDYQLRERDILPWVMKRRSAMTLLLRLQYKAVCTGWWRLMHAKELGGTAITNSASVAIGPTSGNECAGGTQVTKEQEKLGQLSDVMDVLKDITATPRASPVQSSNNRAELWADESEYVWPNLERVMIAYGITGRRVRTKKQAFIPKLMMKYRPEVEFQWAS
ncbi:hypothetical protein BGZ58_002476 [Dissophora ornata]|nr:hypothetical protein BGZ58_002476 [Dissophora ornata]